VCSCCSGAAPQCATSPLWMAVILASCAGGHTASSWQASFPATFLLEDFLTYLLTRSFFLITSHLKAGGNTLIDCSARHLCVTGGRHSQLACGEQSDSNQLCDDAFVLHKAKPPYSKANHHLNVVKKNRGGGDRESYYSSQQVFLCCW